MKDYICIHGFTSLRNYRKYMDGDPLECKFEHCPRSGFRSDWEELNLKCSYRRIAVGGKQ